MHRDLFCDFCDTIYLQDKTFQESIQDHNYKELLQYTSTVYTGFSPLNNCQLKVYNHHKAKV